MKAVVKWNTIASFTKKHIELNEGDEVSISCKDIKDIDKSPKYMKCIYNGEVIGIEADALSVTQAETLEDAIFLQKCVEEVESHNSILFMFDSNSNKPFAYAYGNEIGTAGMLSNVTQKSLLSYVIYQFAENAYKDVVAIYKDSVSRLTRYKDGKPIMQISGKSYFNLFMSACEMVKESD